MRILIAAVLLGIAALVGFVVVNERERIEAKAALEGPSLNEHELITTISSGEEVDVSAHIPRQGIGIVNFTADF